MRIPQHCQIHLAASTDDRHPAFQQVLVQLQPARKVTITCPTCEGTRRKRLSPEAPAEAPADLDKPCGKCHGKGSIFTYPADRPALATAVDGFVLAQITVVLEQGDYFPEGDGEREPQLLIPAEHFAQAFKTKPDLPYKSGAYAESVYLGLGEDVVRFGDHSTRPARYYDGQFPNYRQVIPTRRMWPREPGLAFDVGKMLRVCQAIGCATKAGSTNGHVPHFSTSTIKVEHEDGKPTEQGSLNSPILVEVVRAKPRQRVEPPFAVVMPMATTR